MAGTLKKETVSDTSASIVETKSSGQATLWYRLTLLAVMLVSLFMNFYQLGANGFGNSYYAAGIRSMLDNWSNFFFVSYDPGGFVSLDKPPLGFWLQVASSWIFGFTAFSVYLPQALAGLASVAILYWLVKRHFGPWAGILAALALAVSPISVVTNRNNTIDSTLTLALLIGAWAVLKAAEKGKLRWLLVSALMVGLGFNIKMLQAYLVVPAFGLLYLLASPGSVWKRVWHTAVALLLLLVVSFSWAVAVDLTPSSQRPYVGSTQDNSVISLATGYNGIERLFGQNRGGNPGGFNGGQNPFQQNSGEQPPAGYFPQNDGSNPFGNGNNNGRQGTIAGGFSHGETSPFKLFNEDLGGQIGWLLPFALLGMIALVWQKKIRFPLELDNQQRSLILWGMWFLTVGIFFSVAQFFHEYYLTVMAPAVAALFGIGAVVMWRDYRKEGWKGWLLPLALAVTIATQIYILRSYSEWSAWLTPTLLIVGGLSILMLVVAKLVPQARMNAFAQHYVVGALCAGALALLIVPTTWAAIPVLNGYNAQLPLAGPNGGSMGGFARNGNVPGGFNGTFPGGGYDGDRRDGYNDGGDDRNNPGSNQPPANGGSQMGGMGGQTSAAMIKYLEEHQGSARYLVAVPSSQSGSEIILQTNKPVMALGGFSGSDPILTTDELAQMVKDGVVHYFLLGGMGGGMGGSSSVTSWVQSNCTAVSASEWGGTDSSSSSSSSGLYYCASK